MTQPERGHHLAALALGAGAGKTGPAADTITAAHVIEVSGLLVLTAPGETPVAIRPAWVPLVRQAVETNSTGKLTEVYGSAGRQRHTRRMSRSVSAPAFKAERLRTSWIRELHQHRLPVPVIAAAAGVAPSSVAPHGRALLESADFASPDRDERVQWLGTAAPSCPPRIDLAVPDVFVDPPQPPDNNDDALIEGRVLRDPVAAQEWTRGYGAEIAALVGPMPAIQRRNCVAAAAAQLTWAVHRPGTPIRAEVLLGPKTIESFCRTSPSAGLHYRGRLLALAAACGTGTSSAPADVRATPSMALPAAAPEDLRADDRRMLDAHRILGLGAGLHPHEVDRFKTDGVERLGDDRVITVDGRLTVLGRSFVDELDDLLASTEPGGFVTGLQTTRTSNRRHRIAQALDGPFDPSAFRRAWLRTQLTRGVPYIVLAPAAGDHLHTIDDLLQDTETPSVADVIAWTSIATPAVPPTR